MSSYVDAVLADGEQIVHRAAISHWTFFRSYFSGALLIAAGVGVGVSVPNLSGPWMILAAALVVSGIAVVLSAVIRRQTTELVLTDKRIITKRGLVSRETVEMNLSKIESLHVNQGLMGRILDYGDVTMVGTGASLEPLRGIARPLELRKKLGGIGERAAPAANNRPKEIGRP